MIVTEAELPTEWASSFAVPEYTLFLSPMSDNLDKCRVVILVRSKLAVEANARICDECELA
jgi:hypothetical protein